MIGRCRAIFFDAGFTLMDVTAPVGHTYAEVAARHGVSVTPDALELAFRGLWQERGDALRAESSVALEREWWFDLVREVFGRVGKWDAFGDAFEEFFEELYVLYSTPEAWRVFEDAEPALNWLGALGIRLAVVSNWDPRLPGLLDKLGLGQSFEFVLTSAEAGCRKPNPRIFEQALERLGVSAEQAWHVGDSYEDDVAGASNAGLTPVLIDRTGRLRRPCATVRSLTELPGWIECQGTGG